MTHTGPTPQLPEATRYSIRLRNLAMDDLLPLVRLFEQYETDTGRPLTIDDPEVES